MRPLVLALAFMLTFIASACTEPLDDASAVSARSTTIGVLPLPAGLDDADTALAAITVAPLTAGMPQEPVAAPETPAVFGYSTSIPLINTGGKRWCEESTDQWRISFVPGTHILRQCREQWCCDRIGNKPLIDPNSFTNCGWDRVKDKDGQMFACKPYCADLSC